MVCSTLKLREISYNIPAQEIIKQNTEGTEFVFDHQIAQLIKEGNSDEYTIRIALPEGASIKKVCLGN